MITIDWISYGLGAATIALIWFLISSIKKLKKPKINLQNLKSTVQIAGNKTREVYKSLQELGTIFNEMEQSK